MMMMMMMMIIIIIIIIIIIKDYEPEDLTHLSQNSSLIHVV